METIKYFEKMLDNHLKSLKRAQNAEQISNIHKKIHHVRSAIYALQKEENKKN